MIGLPENAMMVVRLVSIIALPTLDMDVWAEDSRFAPSSSLPCSDAARAGNRQCLFPVPRQVSGGGSRIA